MYEHRGQPLLPRPLFLRRMLGHALVAASLVLMSLGIGVVGYHVTEGLSWLDSLLNASMLLGGMGPVSPLQTVPGKWFASAYALFSGMAFVVTVGILVTPVAHRLLHHLHLDGSERWSGSPSIRDRGRQPSGAPHGHHR